MGPAASPAPASPTCLCLYDSKKQDETLHRATKAQSRCVAAPKKALLTISSSLRSHVGTDPALPDVREGRILPELL